MANDKMYNNAQEKYDELTAAQSGRQQRGLSWYVNPEMDSPGNPVLIQIPDAQFNRAESPWKEQGYSKFTPHVKVVPDGKKVEAENSKPGRKPKEDATQTDSQTKS